MCFQWMFQPLPLFACFLLKNKKSRFRVADSTYYIAMKVPCDDEIPESQSLLGHALNSPNGFYQGAALTLIVPSLYLDVLGLLGLWLFCDPVPPNHLHISPGLQFQDRYLQFAKDYGPLLYTAKCMT